jgi:hypothetical protein
MPLARSSDGAALVSFGTLAYSAGGGSWGIKLSRAILLRVVALASVGATSGTAVAADTGGQAAWIEPGAHGQLAASSSQENFYGELGVVNANGGVVMDGHPFFTPLGLNGRACVSCHQPAYAMSVSAAGLRERWRVTQGKDPVFAAIDGSNCPSLPQDLETSHSLLLDRGLFRVFLPWPPKDARGKEIKPEFAIEVVRDPTGCNTHREFGLRSKHPAISVYRRPRPAANLKYVTANNGAALFIVKNGMPASIDPESGMPTAMNLMSDARQPTLKTQAIDAGLVHLQMREPLSAQQQQAIVDFELQLYAAQRIDKVGGSLQSGSEALSPENLVRGKTGVLGDNFRTPVFGFFEQWKSGTSGDNDTQRAFRASVARGNDVFFTRPFWIRDAMHINTVGLGNPLKRTCATCHNMQMTGMDLTAGWMDLGTTNAPWATEAPELPLFKITCDPDLPPHTFLGRVIYTQDPGRALISGKCNDVGAIVMQQFRGLAARAPYFSNGSAKNLRELVDFYDRRFNIRFSEQEKQDLVNFLSVL